MEKKLTKAEALKKLETMMDSHEELAKKVNIEIPKFLAVTSHVQGGERIWEGVCHNCGYEGVLPDFGRYSLYNSTSCKCPRCGNTNIAKGSIVAPATSFYYGHRNHNYKLYVEENENGYSFFIYEPKYLFGDGEKDGRSDEWMKKDVTADVVISYVGLFDKLSGMFIYTCDGRFSAKPTQSNTANAYSLLCSLLPDDKKYLIEMYEEYAAKKETASEKRKLASKKYLLEEMRLNFKPKAVDNDKIAKTVSKLLFYLDSDRGEKDVYCSVCTSCGDSWLIECDKGEQPRAITACPKCGAEFSQDNLYYSCSNTVVSTNVIVFENTNLPENDLLMRAFVVNQSIDIKDPTKTLKTSVKEIQRVFAGKQLCVYTANDYNEFKKDTLKDLCFGTNSWRNKSSVVFNSNEEVADIIRNSCLQYSGLIEAYGLGDKRYKKFKDMPDMTYLKAWYKNPSIELVLKANMTSYLRYAVESRPETISTGKTLADALQVSPFVAKIAAKNNFSYSDLVDFNCLYENDHSLTLELFNTIKEQRISPNHLVLLKQQHNIGYKNVVNYLQNVYDHQCIEKREAMSIWVDYLNMAKVLKMDLSDNSRKYPASLKKEHDIAMFAHRAVQIELDKEAFARQAKINEMYEYSYKDLIAIVPKTPQDVVEEATRQRNCLRSYVERIKSGYTVVVFIRYKTTPEDTLYTAEVNQGRLIQLKGYQNSNPRNRELVEFVSHWAKAKGIKVNY